MMVLAPMVCVAAFPAEGEVLGSGLELPCFPSEYDC